MYKIRPHYLLALLLTLLQGLAPPTQAEEPSLPPLGAKSAPALSIREALETGPFAADLRKLYEEHAFRSLWSRDGAPSPQAVALVDALLHADSHGLIPSDYDAPHLYASLTRLIAGHALPDENWTSFDIALSRALMRLGNHLYRGRIDPASLSKLGISIQAKQPLDILRLLDEWSQAADPVHTLNLLEPTTSVYVALKTALPHYRELAKQTPPPSIAPDSKNLRPGESRDNVPTLRKLMQLNGYLDASLPPPANASLYDEALADAVRRFQSRFNLEPDGVVGGQTLKQINMTPAERLEQIRLGMERLRWLPEQHDSAYLIVNVPSFRLYGYNVGEPDLAKPDIGMDVIVGQAIYTHNTPVFHADMQFVVFHPYWNVPYSIAHKELLPLIEKTDNYLAKNDMEIIANDGVSVGLDATQDNINAVDSGQFRLRQRPGPKNALGPIKFVFPNMNSVYLHGTPKQSLFQRARRDLSHGCIRLADPAGLAEFVLKNEKGWDKTRIDSAMQGHQSFTVNLSRSIPVYIFYTTALADTQGQVLFYPDVYGKDEELLRLMGKEGG